MTGFGVGYMRHPKPPDRHFDPDVTRRDEAPYWAAALAVAIRAGDHERVELARANLKRLKCPIDLASRKGVRNDQR